MSNVTVETLLKNLMEGSASFKYRKGDGTIREATGTINNDLIPESSRPANPPVVTGETVAYYDLGSNGWRSFRRSEVVA